MSIVLDGTAGITSPGGDTASVSLATPILKSPSSLTLQTNGSTTAVTIDTSQNVGIGTTSPSLKLTVVGQTLSGTTIGNGYVLNSTGANYGFISNNAPGVWSLGYGTTPATLGTPALSWNSSNNIGLAGANTAATGTGITFPATQSASSNANCLDDYEEGTWTPTFSNITMNGVISYGYYTKVGNVVNLYWFFSRTSSSGPSGQMSLGSLPFSSGGTQVPFFGPVALENVNFASAYAICLIAGTSNTISFAPIANNATFGYLQNSAFNGGAGWICGSISYQVP